MSPTLELVVPLLSQRRQRLDKWLSDAIPDHSRSQIQAWIKVGNVLLNGTIIQEADYRVRPGDRITVILPPPIAESIEPFAVPFSLLYEDDHILVVNKPAGVPTHPGPGHRTDTLLNGLIAAGKKLSPIGLPWRPGVVHRLDKDTSGVLVLAKTRTAHIALVKALKERTVHRVYVAFVVGIPAESMGTISAEIGRHPYHRTRFATGVSRGKSAITHYRLIRAYPRSGLSRLELNLETGRTHQIRVHLSSAHLPVLGDPLYGGRKILCFLPTAVTKVIKMLPGQFLHAARLEFVHPVTHEHLLFSAPVPEPFDLLDRVLRKSSQNLRVSHPEMTI